MSDAIPTALPRVVFVTGTDTGVGKTVVTAALAVALSAAGRTVAVYKPTQAGLEDGGGDIDVVRRLAGIEDVHEGIRLPDPMAPVAAAKRAGVTLPAAAAHVASINRLASGHDHTLVEGAGGILVHLDGEGHTLADIAVATAEAPGSAAGPDGTHAPAGNDAVGMIVVCRAALGTLNHSELTVEALTRREVAVTGLIIGSWPRRPSAVDISNRKYLSRHPVGLLGAVPEQAGSLDPAAFRSGAAGWFSFR